MFDIRLPAGVWGTVADWAMVTVLLGSLWYAKRQVDGARELREEQTRPWVIVDIDAPTTSFFDLYVRNIGPTVARDVRFSFVPALTSTNDVGNNGIANWSIIANGISTLPPGREYRMFFDQGPNRKSAGLPDRYKVTITYEGLTGISYEETYELDLAVFWGMQQIHRRTIHDVYNVLDRLQKKLP